MAKDDLHIEEIRELAKRFMAEEIERCIDQQLQKGENICFTDGPSEHIINELSRAEFVRGLVEKGASLTDALRELARRIRQVQKGVEEDKDKRQ
jgi:hypothetical protein